MNNQQIINLHSNYNSNTERDSYKTKRENSQNDGKVNKSNKGNSLYYNNQNNINNMNSNNTNNKSPLFSPSRKLHSNPNNPVKLDNIIQTERVHSHNSYNSNNTNDMKSRSKNYFTNLNTDRGISADREISENAGKRDTPLLNPREISKNLNRSNTRIQSNKSRQDFRFKLEDNNKPITPPDFNLRKLDLLPVISTNRRKLNKDQVVYDISSVFKEAKNFEKDPIVQKKMEDIIQNIDDIRNVINQKAKNRMKISSAPISHYQKYTFKGISGFVNNDLNLVKNKSKIMGEYKVNNNLNFEKKVTLVAGNHKVPVRLKSLQQ
jgi:hypothetical protein